MASQISGQDLARLLKEQADRIQNNQRKLERTIEELKAAASNLENGQGNNA